MSGLLFALLCAIWSTTWAAIRLCEQGFSPLWAASLRFVVGAALLSAASLVQTLRSGRKAPRIPVWILPVAGLVNALSYSLVYLAERSLTGGTAAVLGATNPFFVLAAAIAFGYERLVWRKLLGLAVGFAGVCLLFRSGLALGRTTAVAMAEVLGAAALLWPTYTVLLRRAGDAGLSGIQAAAGFIRWTCLFTLAGALLLEGRPQLPTRLLPWGALLYLAAIGTALAWSLFAHLLQRLPMTVLSTMLFIEPALALGVDRLLGDRARASGALAGAALILAGVVLSALRWPGRGFPPEPGPAALEALELH